MKKRYQQDFGWKTLKPLRALKMQHFGTKTTLLSQALEHLITTSNKSAFVMKKRYQQDFGWKTLRPLRALEMQHFGTKTTLLSQAVAEI